MKEGGISTSPFGIGGSTEQMLIARQGFSSLFSPLESLFTENFLVVVTEKKGLLHPKNKQKNKLNFCWHDESGPFKFDGFLEL